MTTTTRKHFSPTFRLEAARLVVDQNYSIREAADAMNVGKSCMDKWVRLLRLERKSMPGGGSPITPDQLRIKDAGKAGKACRGGERNPIKGYGSLDVRLVERFALVDKLRESHPVKRLCEVFNVYRSSYKYWKARRHVEKLGQVALNESLVDAHKDSGGFAGARPIVRIVTNNGDPLSRYRATKRLKALDFFRGLRSEWVPETGYSSLEHAKRSILNYIIDCDSQTRPHTFNDGLSPNAFERQHAKKRTACPKLLDHYSVI
jgi:transposase